MASSLEISGSVIVECGTATATLAASMDAACIGTQIFVPLNSGAKRASTGTSSIGVMSAIMIITVFLVGIASAY